MADNFNSSDIEFEPRANDKQAKYRGEASIELLIRNAEADRITSKRTVKQLQYGHGAPGTRNPQSLWVNRFNAYREHTLKQDLNVPFTGDDVLRFFDAIIPKIKPSDANKPVPSLMIFINAFGILSSYGNFTWDAKEGFGITKRDGLRLQTFLDDAVKAGRIIKGHWRTKTWIGFVTLSRMVRAFLEHSEAHGCINWDIVLARSFAVVLVSSLSSRSGDVARSKGYVGAEYMHWHHIDLYLEGEPKFLNLRAEVTIEYVKGSKDTLNDVLVRYLRPLEHPDTYHICPIALMVVHALRHGLVLGSSLNEVLVKAAAAPGRRVKWKHPNLPVLAAFALSPPHCDLNQPATPDQLLRSIKQMGLISNMLTRVYMQATRSGAARDIAHLPKSDDGFGAITDDVRQSLGHSEVSKSKGVTESYVGGSSREVYNARAANASVSHRREPKFSDVSAYTAVSAEVTKAEMEDWRSRHKDLVERGKYADKTVRENIRRERTEHFAKTAPIETKVPSPYPQIGKSTQPSDKTESKGSGLTPTHDHGAQSNDFDDSLIDPSLLNLDLENMENLEVNEDAFNQLRASILPTESASTSSTGQESTQTIGSDKAACSEKAFTEEAARVLMVAEDPMARLTAEQWIEHYARINVVQNELFARKWKAYSEKDESFESTIGPHSLRGNSRDDPTPWFFKCSKSVACTYQSLHRSKILNHEIICNKALVEEGEGVSTNGDLPCTWEGCERTFSNESKLRRHVKGYHEFTPKACEHGCDPTHLYQNEPTYQEHQRSHNFTQKACEHGCDPTNLYHDAAGYNRHQRKKHSGQWPIRCLYPECTDDRMYRADLPLRRHLRDVHGVAEYAEQAQYLPPPPGKMDFLPQTCFYEGCTSQTTFTGKGKMLRHLRNVHKLSATDADDLLKERGQFTTSARRVVSMSDGRRKRRPRDQVEMGASKRSKTS